jgi:2-keto-4-pentenoate hydratase
MTLTMDELVAHIDSPGIDSDPSRDILKVEPELTREQALQVQLAVKRRHADAGDGIVGHQASFTSAGIRRLFPDAPMPMVGTLLRSLVLDDGESITLDAEENFVECEIALLLRRDLEGPHLKDMEVLAAIECFLPAIEIAPLRQGVRERVYSYQHMIAVQKALGGFIVLGRHLTPAKGVDVALEGCRVSIDGVVRGAATGHEAMGGPLKVVGAMARTLHAIGERLHAGQIILTGSLPSPPSLTRANRVAQVEFSRLGSVTVCVS